MGDRGETVSSYWDMVRDPNCAVRVRHLLHCYGRTRALDDVSLTIRRGDVFGLVGSNGAGKTTLLRILATLILPTRGQVYVLRHSLRQKSHLARIGIGYMPDSITIREDLTVLEYLQFYASLYATDPKARSRSPADALDLVGLAGREQARARDLSLGMQQRLSLARLLLHDPKVLLLDEPSAGLDPAGRIELKDLLARMAAIGKTILLSSHILSDVGQACNRIGILEKGKLLFHGTLPDLLSAAVPTRRFEVRLRGEGRHEQAREALRRLLPDVEAEVSGGALHVKLRRDPEEPARVFRALVTEGFTPSTFRPEQVDLEEAFFSLTRASAP